MDSRGEEPDCLFVVRFNGLPPADGLDDAPEVIGGFIVCYVRANSFFGAIEQAAAAIAEDGWIVSEPEYAERCETSELLEDEEDATYAREAMADGMCLVYVTYKADDE